jgi:uncharacterized OB-fold protein
MPELTGKLAKEISQIQEKVSRPEIINEPTESKCLRCGNHIRPDDRFCRHCGTPIGD